jgi:hypothetical protein
VAQEPKTISTRAAVPPAEEATANAAQSPFCRELRSKKYYFLQEMPTETHHMMDGSGHCWCRKTMQILGPDGEMVRAEDCTSGRSCYKSLFES